jgi:hypothetical protein
LPPVTNAIEVIELANKMLKRAGYTIHHISEVRPIDPRFWQVKAIAYPLTNVRMKIDGENGKVVEFIKEYSPYPHVYSRYLWL